MADHSELVAEMALLEKAGTQERLKRARERRMQQLHKWSQREKKFNGKSKKNTNNMKSKNKDYKVHFVPSVMLLEAAARNDVTEVRRLLMLGVSPDSTNEDGLTALHQCCIDDSEEMMKLLIEFGANVNAKDSEQWTPLHAAATCGHLHLVKYLINKGADLLAVNADGNMPYDICEDESTLDYIESEMAKKGVTQEMIDETRAATEMQMLVDLKMLKDNGEDLEYRDHQGATPLHIAAANGYLSVVEFLLENNASTDVCDNDLWQPIHAAACWGHPDVMEMLVQAGADLSARTKNGEAPFDICEDPELKERILQLKNELETKRASRAADKLRRSHSQNTRSQSVRRTSIREKGQISRREIMEEKRMRHEKQDQHNKSDEDDEIKLQQDAKKSEKLTVPVDLDDVDITLADAKDALQRVKTIKSETADVYQASVVNLRTDLEPADGAPDVRNSGPADVQLYNPAEDSYSAGNSDVQHHSLTRTQGESVKVEIHVTVNTSPTYSPSPGTLAEVKKKRSDMRSRNSISSSGSSQQQDAVGGKVVSQNGYRISATCTYDRPPSPTISLKRFASDPTEVVGGDHSKQGCCSVM